MILDRSNVRKERSTVSFMKMAAIVVVGIIAIMPWILFLLDIRFGPCLIVFSIALSMGLFRSLIGKRKFRGAFPQFQFAVESFTTDRIRETDIGKTSDEESLGHQEKTLSILPEYDCDEENDRNRSLPTQKQSTDEQQQQQQLQWNERVRVKVVRNLEEYTIQEKDDCWYSAEEYIRMDRERIRFKAAIRPDENEHFFVLGGKPSLQQSMQWITQRFGKTTLNSTFMDLSNHSHIL